MPRNLRCLTAGGVAGTSIHNTTIAIQGIPHSAAYCASR
jgi:hypothetical protein